MQLLEGRPIFSATDLNNHLECRHLTFLEALAARGEVEKPSVDASADLVARKGNDHERRHLERLQGIHGHRLIAFEERPERTLDALARAEADTLDAMAQGPTIIYQATFFDGQFLGHADFLRRIEKPCERWPWSYEVIDTKLALTPKPYFVLQLCNYNEHLARLQGTVPEHGYIVLGNGIERRFRLDDYAAYYRYHKSRFLADVDAAFDTYPVECTHCAVCRWAPRCESRRDRDDYLGLVAWMRKNQIDRLRSNGIDTLAALAAATPEQRPFGMAEKTFDTLRRQAELQHLQRRAFATRAPGERHFWTFVETVEEGLGLAALPEPDAGDVFFDIEGDPLYAPDHGLDYLFGMYLPFENEYRAFWAKSDREERAAFEGVVDFLDERRRRFPKMHVYHYAPYETTSLKRLMGRYNSRHEAIDRFLRADAFVDLYSIVRQGIRISQPSYSIKKLEVFYGFVRTAQTRGGDDSIVNFESWLESGDDATLDDIRRYNEEDCRSTAALRDWLVDRRAELARREGRDIPWKVDAEPNAAPADAADVDALAQALVAKVPEPMSVDEFRMLDDEYRLRWLLGHLLEYHRREAKPAYWEYFDRSKNRDQLAEFDKQAIGDLTLCADVAPYKLSARDLNEVVTYSFPEQDHNLRAGSAPHCPASRLTAGTLVKVDDAARRLEIKLAKKMQKHELRALIPQPPINDDSQRAAVRRVAASLQAGTLARSFPAVRDVLLAATPRLRDRLPGMPLASSIDAADIARTALSLDDSYLFIQGPPGSGKSTKAAAVIVELLQRGKRIGVVSRGHKAVHNLLHKVEHEAGRRGYAFSGIYKASTRDEGSEFRSTSTRPAIRNVTAIDDIDPHGPQLFGGTPWLFAEERFVGTLDYLVVDEAGQVSLADVVACGAAARNIILLGDPLQLPQVLKGSHPIGADASALEHLLGSDVTVRPERGIFLDVTYRMHPDICAFVSDAVYEGRLHAIGTGRHAVFPEGVAESGLRYVPTPHEGNGRESPEEAAAVVREIRRLLNGTVRVRDDAPRPFTPNDVLVVTPYNLQRLRVERALEDAGITGVRVGTVDKFQGQEAPVVVYSMATSSGDDLPRDMTFLFDKNRFNVAISRAQCLTILVCSPLLRDVRCTSPEQMALVNLLCSFVEFAACQTERTASTTAPAVR